MANLVELAFETYNIPTATKDLSDFIASCNVLPSGEKIFLQALRSDFKDKEDAIQYFTALEHEVNYFITRNHKEYTPFTTGLVVHAPATLVDSI